MDYRCATGTRYDDDVLENEKGLFGATAVRRSALPISVCVRFALKRNIKNKINNNNNNKKNIKMKKKRHISQMYILRML